MRKRETGGQKNYTQWNDPVLRNSTDIIMWPNKLGTKVSNEYDL